MTRRPLALVAVLPLAACSSGSGGSSFTESGVVSAGQS